MLFGKKKKTFYELPCSWVIYEDEDCIPESMTETMTETTQNAVIDLREVIAFNPFDDKVRLVLSSGDWFNVRLPYSEFKRLYEKATGVKVQRVLDSLSVISDKR